MRQPRSRVWMVVFTAAGLIAPALALYAMCNHWVAVPYWDEWKTPGEQIASWYRGTLTLQELFSQHNESRKFFPRLVYLPVALSTGWDVRAIMLLSFGYMCAGSGLLYALARRTADSAVAGAAMFAAMNTWLFWPRQYESLLLSIQGELFTPAFALAAAWLVNLSRSSIRAKTIANAALAFVATYTVANGMLVWVLGFPMRARRDSPGEPAPAESHIWRVAYVAAGITAIACYFYGYRHPPLSPPFVRSTERWPELAVFVARWLGDITLPSAPLVAGSLAVALFAAVVALSGRHARAETRWRHYPFVALGIYTILSGCITAAGRLAFGADAATHWRYAPFTATLYIAGAGLFGSIYAEVAPHARRRRLWRAVALIGAAIMAWLYVATWRLEQPLLREIAARREHLAHVVRWSKAIPTNPDLAILSPYETTLDTIRTLSAHGSLHPQLVDDALAVAVAQRPQASDDAAGALSRAEYRQRTGAWRLSGSARIPDQNRPADCVIIGVENAAGAWAPLTVLGFAPTPARTRDHADARNAFDHQLVAPELPVEGSTLRGWSIDLRRRIAFPMAGAVRLTAAPN